MKNFFYLACIVLGALYFFFKDKDMTDIHKAIGNPAVRNRKTLSEKRKEAEKINLYEVGQCIRISNKSSWEIYKITKIDLEKKDYYYSLCVKFKGCKKEELREIISNFEYDYPPTRKIPCF